MAGFGSAHAVTTDSVILTITPVFNLSVNISSDTCAFGLVALKSSVSVCIGKIMNDGDVTSAWQKQSANAASGGVAWTLKTSGSTGKDEFRLLAVATGTGVSPTFSGTAGNSCVLGDATGINVTDAFTELTEGGASSPVHPLGETRDLWVSIMMPTNVSAATMQTITLSVRAVNR